MRHFLEFEKPIAELEGKIEELRRTTDAGGIDVAEEIGRGGGRHGPLPGPRRDGAGHGARA
jgi:acetyl-CoA carboxylase alpha subunit